MQLYELIHQLKRIEETLWGHIKVYIKWDYWHEIELFAIVPEKDDQGEYMLVLE